MRLDSRSKCIEKVGQGDEQRMLVFDLPLVDQYTLNLQQFIIVWGASLLLGPLRYFFGQLVKWL